MARYNKTESRTLVEKIELPQDGKEKFVELPRIIDKRGNLSVIESGSDVLFDIKRVYWIYDVPGGEKRGGHAFRQQYEMVIALSGSFDVVLDDGAEQRKYTLNRSYNALCIPSMLWRSLENFSANSVCLVLSSEVYDEGDYIRNFKLYKEELLKVDRDLASQIDLMPISEKIDCNPRLNTIDDCLLFKFPVVKNRKGNITPVHSQSDIPFSVKRVFFIYDIPGRAKRGMHAHKHCHEVLIATSGSFEVELDDGVNKRTVVLNHPAFGLYVPPGIWAVQKGYSSGAVCLVLASDEYDASDYINTYSEFIKYRCDED